MNSVGMPAVVEELHTGAVNLYSLDLEAKMSSLLDFEFVVLCLTV